MDETKILLVESDPKTACSINSIINHLGHKVVKTANDGASALKSAIDLQPDLVLMDISIKGEMNGIDTAVQIHQSQDIPIIFLVGEADQLDLETLKQADNDGIVFKPIIETELRCIIELALTHHKEERRIKTDQALLSTTLKSIGDAVITTDNQALITFLNPVAEKLTGWSLSEAVGKPILQIFNIINEDTQLPAKNPLKNILGKGMVVGLANHTVLISKKGKKIPIDDSGAPIKDEYGNIEGAVLVFRDITQQKKAKSALEFEKTLIDALLNYFPEYIFFKDLKSRFYRVSKSLATEVFGLNDPKEAIGKSDFDFFPEQFAQSDYKSEQDIITTGKSIIDKEEKRQWVNGSVSWASSTKMPLVNSKGEIIGTFGISKNMTEKKQMQEALRKSEERYRLQFEEALDAIFIADAETGILLDCNRAAIVLVGREKSEIIGQHQSILHPDDEGSKAFKQHIKQKISEIIETQIITKSGEIRDVAIKANVFDLENRKVLQGIFRDITEQKRAEEALRYEKSLMDALMETLPDHIYFKDRDSRFLRMSKSQTERFGLDDPQKAIGKSDFDFFTQEHAKMAFQDERRIIQSEQPVIGIEEKETWPDGSETWVSTTKLPLKDINGQIIGTFGVSRDITEQKRAEEALASERNLLKTVIDNLPDKIYAKDTESRFIMCNKAVAKRMGKSNPEEIIGKTDFDFVEPMLAAKFHANEHDIIKSGQPLIDHEEPLDQLEGGRRWNSATKVPLRDQQGNVIGIVGIGRDITDRKLAEEQREKVILELQEALNKINTLKGLIPICACCKKIRDDKGYWNNVESYIQTHADVEFTHGICPDCMKKLYPDYYKKKDNPEKSKE